MLTVLLPSATETYGITWKTTTTWVPLFFLFTLFASERLGEEQGFVFPFFFQALHLTFATENVEIFFSAKLHPHLIIFQFLVSFHFAPLIFTTLQDIFILLCFVLSCLDLRASPFEVQMLPKLFSLLVLNTCQEIILVSFHLPS